MPPERFPRISDRISGPRVLSPQTGSTIRLALVACSVVGTVAALLVVALHTRSAESALEEAAARTLSDYTGYAGRLMGSEMLRRFSEQRSRVLASVTGASGRGAPPPPLDDVARAGDRELDFGPDADRGYFRLDLRTGGLETRGAFGGPFGARVADTLRAMRAFAPTAPDPNVIVLLRDNEQYSVAYATYADARGKPLAMYGLGYRRMAGISYWANRVFSETPLLPTSYAGTRWNYDTTAVRPGEVKNASLLTVRVADRGGQLLWRSPGEHAEAGDIRERTIISTSAGGLTIETALRPAAQPALLPAVVRRAQRWSMRALLVLTIMLAAISLVALLSERAVARARRIEAMEQLALGLRHELNNALASLLLNAELAAEEPELSEGTRERLAIVTEQAQRMRDVLRRLERRERLDVIVPYRDEGFMVDLSAPESEPFTRGGRGET